MGPWQDVLALGSFFHYAGGYTPAEAFDLTFPETNVVGQLKDVLFPSKRMDLYACVQAQKRADSPHGVDVVRAPEGTTHEITGRRYMPKSRTYGAYY